MQGLKCALAGLLLAGAAGMAAQEPQKPTPAPAPAEQVPTPELKPLPEAPEPVAGDAVYAPLATGQGPESMKTRVDSWLVITFGPRAVVSPMISAGIRMARPNEAYPPDWRQGMQGYARQYGSSMGTKAAFQTARFGAAAVLHEDFRYRPSHADGFFPRTFYAMGFAFVDRGPSGEPRLALANLVGAAAGGFVPNLWLPDGFNRGEDGAKRTATKFGGFMLQNVMREFSPEIAKAFQALHLPFPRLPIPEWWTKDISVGRRP